MHHNDLKYGEIVDNFCYIPKSFCSIKTGLGGQCWLVLGLLFRIWAELKSMDIIALEMDSMTSKTPDNMYHT